ncbi:MAG: 30S ribosomal protein S4 [Clostridia bacterium]|nr:30S ribosomal protein S4 [Clostridia bacterium]
MAKSKGPVLKRCRSLGIDPTYLGYDKKSNKNPKASHRKVSEYGLQLKEKQKTKWVYGVQEKQFRGYFEEASRRKGITGTILLQILESRLDNVVYRLGLASTRAQARALVSQGHFLVDGKKVNIPSYLTKVGEEIKVKESSASKEIFKQIVEENAKRAVPTWLEANKDAKSGKIVAVPEREQIDLPVEEHLIVELYSK